MRVTVRKKRWDLVFKSLAKADHWGFCDDPGKPGKKIVIDKNLTGEKRLDVTIHELLHSAHWQIDEEYVAETARDIARVLWKLGYRLGGEGG